MRYSLYKIHSETMLCSIFVSRNRLVLMIHVNVSLVDLNEMQFSEPLILQFRGRVCELSKQKFSSNVIEKVCLTLNICTPYAYPGPVYSRRVATEQKDPAGGDDEPDGVGETASRFVCELRHPDCCNTLHCPFFALTDD